MHAAACSTNPKNKTFFLLTVMGLMARSVWLLNLCEYSHNDNNNAKRINLTDSQEDF